MRRRNTLDETITRVLRKNIQEEINRNDVENIVSDRISSKMRSNDFEKRIKEIVANSIEDLYKTLYYRSNSWKSGVK